MPAHRKPIDVQQDQEGPEMTKGGDNGSIVFITVGFPFSSIPIATKVMTFVPKESTIDRSAKNLRSLLASHLEIFGFERGSNFTSEELYFEVYGSIANEVPIYCSANARYWRNWRNE